LEKKLEEKMGRPESMSWAMQQCEGGMDFLRFHPPSPHACVDGCKLGRREKL